MLLTFTCGWVVPTNYFICQCRCRLVTCIDVSTNPRTCVHTLWRVAFHNSYRNSAVNSQSWCHHSRAAAHIEMMHTLIGSHLIHSTIPANGLCTGISRRHSMHSMQRIFSGQRATSTDQSLERLPWVWKTSRTVLVRENSQVKIPHAVGKRFIDKVPHLMQGIDVDEGREAHQFSLAPSNFHVLQSCEIFPSILSTVNLLHDSRSLFLFSCHSLRIVVLSCSWLLHDGVATA